MNLKVLCIFFHKFVCIKKVFLSFFFFNDIITIAFWGDYMSNVNDDLVVAQKIMERDYFNFGGVTYHDTSVIYKVSNEVISAVPYQKSLMNKEKVLSVIASGDQILNSVLCGSTVIDGFDVSVFPKYFLQLKLAAISKLNREDFIQFFLENPKYSDIFSYDTYEKIRENLSEDALVFWDGLFDYYDGYDIYNSTLFSSELYTTKAQSVMNPYLKEQNYDLLKEKIKNVKLRFFDGNIFKLIDTLKDGYDLVNLSSIIYYNEMYFRDYLDFLHRLPLNERGIAITYLYDVFGKSKRLGESLMDDENISFDSFYFLEKKQSDCILTYQKKK